MKNLDLSILRKDFPKIPEIRLIVEKNGEMHIFDTWKDLEEWTRDSFDKEVYDWWRNLESDEKRGYSDMSDWFADLSADDIDSFLWDMGWYLTRKDSK